MGVLIITGLSGAGKTLASNTLEDIGYNCIDNLPPSLISNVCKISDVNKLAVVIDCRSKQLYDTLESELDELKKTNVDYTLIFLDCDEDVLLRRYKYTRRPHPLQDAEHPALTAAIQYEKDLTEAIKQRADKVIDTTHLEGKQLKQVITDTFRQEDYSGLTLKIMSFGFKNGLPSEADLVYDVRCMPNPFYVPALRTQSGQDQDVVDFVFSFEQSNKLLEMMRQFVSYALPYYIEEGKSELVVCIGCTSGHHRSVAFAERLAEQLKELNHRIVLVHRDIRKEFDHS